MSLLKAVRSNLICKGRKVVQFMIFISWVCVIYWFAIHIEHFPSAQVNVSTNNSILSAFSVFSCAVCFTITF